MSEVGYSGKHRVKGLKRTIVIDAQGNPLALVLAPANRHDLGLAQATVGQATLPDRKQRLKRLGADKGYDAESLRRFLRQRQITPCLSYRVNHVQPVPVAERREHRYSQQRWKVERTFAWMNNTVHPTFTHVFRPANFAESEAAQADVRNLAAAKFRQHLERIQSMIAHAAPWLLGDKPSFADFYALVFLRWGGFAGIDPASLPAYKAFVDRVAAHPAVAAAMAREGIDLDTYKPQQGAAGG